jgi:hypothetical protein
VSREVHVAPDADAAAHMVFARQAKAASLIERL